MKTQINLAAVSFLVASAFTVPQVAQAQPPLALAPPCTAASLTGKFLYELRGTVNSVSETQAGLLNLDGAGNFTNKFTESVNGVVTRGALTQGAYTISSDCKTGTLIFHGGYGSPDCSHFSVTFGASPVLLGVPPGTPIAKYPGNIVVLTTDGQLACTDSDAQVWNIPTKTYASTYTGTLAQQ